MAYVKTVWNNGSTALSAENMNHIENGIESLDQTKLDISSGAEPNQNAFSYVKVGSTTIAADSKTDTLELVAGDNVTLTPDATNDKVTISMTGFITEEYEGETRIYRKWSSGIAECWYKWSSGSFSPETAVGGFYGRTLGPFDFPSGLFIEKPSAIFNLDSWGNGYFWGSARNVTKDSFYLNVLRNDNAASAGSGTLYAIGKWK